MNPVNKPINLYFLRKQTQKIQHHQEYPSKTYTQSPAANNGYTISADEINGGGVGGDDDLLIKQVVSSDSVGGDDDLLIKQVVSWERRGARLQVKLIQPLNPQNPESDTNNQPLNPKQTTNQTNLKPTAPLLEIPKLK